MAMLRILLFLILLVIVNGNGTIDFGLFKGYHFPTGSAMGILLAIALPIDLPDKSVFLAFNYEAVYSLPGNETYNEFPPLIEGRGLGIDRKLVYDAIEAKMATNGISGKKCLLRTICEAAMHTVEHNGLIGDILHILLTPSTTKNPKDFSDDYENAEREGKSGKCLKYNSMCSLSFLSLISWIGRSF